MEKKKTISKKNTKRKKAASPLLSKLKSKWLWIGVACAALLYVVVFCFLFVTPYSFRWRAFYDEPSFPEGYDVHGIDISHYQGNVKWEKVRNARVKGAPVSFVIIKATEGTDLTDELFQRNFSHAHRNDIIRGAYHYFKPGSDARKQAQLFIRTAALEPGDLPPVLDVEEIGSLTTSELQRDVKVWLDLVEKEYGAKPIIYTGKNFKTKYLNNSRFDEYHLWLAHYYVKEMVYDGKWTLWQHTDLGKVDGIKGWVDCNIFNGSMQDLLDMTIKETQNEI